MEVLLRISLRMTQVQAYNAANQAICVLINTLVLFMSQATQTLKSLSAQSSVIEMLKISSDASLCFVLCRLLFYICLDKEMLSSLTSSEDVHDLLFKCFFESVEPGFEKNADSVKLACESLKVLFLLNSEKTYSGDKSA